jgi:hypothetical protein
MEALVFVERMGRHGEVAERYALNKLPARIGRNYQSDVILDDIHVASEHIEIRSSEDGGFEIEDLGSINGTYLRGEVSRIQTRQIADDDIYRLGQTQLRIRLPSHIVPQEIAISNQSLARNSLVFVAAMLICVATLYMGIYVKTFGTDTSKLFMVPANFTISLLAWAGMWALVNRILHGRGNYVAHGNVIFLGITALLWVEVVTDYADFMFDLEVPFLLWIFGEAVVIAVTIYAHLHLTLRTSRYIRVGVSVFVSGILSALIYGLPLIEDEDKIGLQSYNIAIKPSMFLFSKGVTPEQFIDSAKQLKVEVDEYASQTAR